MKKRGIYLYSPTLVTILSALIAWMIVFNQTPQEADLNELQKIMNDFEQVKRENAKSDVGKDLMMAWWYPGEPACGAITDVQKHGFDVVKPEYFIVVEGGVLELMTVELYGCNGYSAENVALVRSLADKQFVTVSSAYSVDMDSFLVEDAKAGQYTKELVDFVVQNNLTGIEIDFEDFSSWSHEVVSRYKDFLRRLGNALHAENKQLMVDLPPLRAEQDGWYKFKLADFNELPINYIVIMGYDYQYDYGVGKPVAPLDWLKEVVEYTVQHVENKEKIVIGVSSYGYRGDMRTRNINILTQEQAKTDPLFSLLQRDEASWELIAREKGKALVVQDQESLDRKIRVINEAGIKKVSIWHLGGNPLPTKNKVISE